MLNRLFFLRNVFWAASLLMLAGCSSYSTDERLSNLESRMTGMQVLDLRMDRMEEKVSLLEQDMGQVKSAVAGEEKKKNTRSGKKSVQQAGKKISPITQPATEHASLQNPREGETAQDVPTSAKEASAVVARADGNINQAVIPDAVVPASAEGQQTGAGKNDVARFEGQVKTVVTVGAARLNAVKNHAEPKEKNAGRNNATPQPDSGKISAPSAQQGSENPGNSLAVVGAVAGSADGAGTGGVSPWAASGMNAQVLATSGDALASQGMTEPVQPVAQSGNAVIPAGVQSESAVTPAATQSDNTATQASLAGAEQSKQTKLVKNKGKSAYDKALALYNSKKLDQSLWAFQAFVKDYPDSSLVPNALYWSGECRYASGRYSEAIMEFKNLVTKYPADNKTSAALLKIGYSYLQLQDVENAKFYLDILLEDFPKSAPAKLARQRLASLK